MKFGYRKFHFKRKGKIILEIVLSMRILNLNTEIVLKNLKNYLNFSERERAPHNVNSLGESIKLDSLIDIDNVSELADKSEEFANFLTVSRKFGMMCVYIFIQFTRQDKTGKLYFHRLKY